MYPRAKQRAGGHGTRGGNSRLRADTVRVFVEAVEKKAEELLRVVLLVPGTEGR